MDFLDPIKKHAHKVRLLIGYVLMAVLVILSTVILLYQAYGYGFDKYGQIIQNGLVFVSSAPTGADIYLNDSSSHGKTNTRLVLPAGQYTLKLQRDGYRPWLRSLGVEGGSVERFDYPLLFPTKLTTASVHAYAAQPGLITQSPDRRWLIVAQSDSAADFDLYDLSNRTQPPTTLTLPTNVITFGPGAQGWQFVSWANDNRRVLLQHVYAGGSEYILLDRQTPSDSVNLTKTLALNSNIQLALSNKRYDHYFVYDPVNMTLGNLTLSDPTIAPLLSHVLAFKTYNDNIVLYATDAGTSSGQATVALLQDTKSYKLRTVAAGGAYELNLASYNGSLYVAAGAAVEDKIYVYQDPLKVLQSSSGQPLVPAAILKVTEPNTLNFSSGGRFIAAENGQSFVVYDALNDKTYSYQLSIPVDAGQYAAWMDNDRLVLTSDGKIVVFDYDDANQTTLSSAEPGALPYFDAKYQYFYNLAPATSGPDVNLTSTALTVPPAN